ncbi:efflux transporter, RND family, MFP subunit [Thermodesulfatator indicus DSM 15286]|uniref:Efflux transporter, RND family, MFP subunit n=1 Tax=Thermodesulfatator indicus (strain DSM 15286 / JCM 11887 / CIR29812) TaxID=667014 RepID=F8A8X4_THEID|nr:efflux RND transporter periplasmic adaptor subunit [Thermodesulfatator indicus]AEH44021.1 efflux transporter, RND family, MFP subunit [Thermodesulfatator indicus DSM 15286]
MNKLKPFLILLVVFLLIFGAFRVVKLKKETIQSVKPPQKIPLPVEVAKVTKGTLEIREHYLGTITPVHEANIATRISGYILRITKYEGDKVKKGELLVEIEAKDIEAKLGVLKTQLASAQTELLVRKGIFERNQKLLEHEAISQEAFDLSKAAYQAALARVEQLKQEIEAAKVNLSYAFIKAPFSGVVTRRFKNPGDMATPGAPLITLEDPKAGYRLLVNIPQEKAASIVPGDRVYISLGDRQKIAAVYKVYPAVSKEALATVEIRLKKRPFSLPSGASLGVDLVLANLEGLLLPAKALVPGKSQGVYVVEKGRLKFIPVRVLGQSKGQVVASGKLNEGDQVVVGDPGLLLRLYPGQKVIPIKGGHDESI